MSSERALGTSYYALYGDGRRADGEIWLQRSGEVGGKV